MKTFLATTNVSLDRIPQNMKLRKVNEQILKGKKIIQYESEERFFTDKWKCKELIKTICAIVATILTVGLAALFSDEIRHLLIQASCRTRSIVIKIIYEKGESCPVDFLWSDFKEALPKDFNSQFFPRRWMEHSQWAVSSGSQLLKSNSQFILETAETNPIVLSYVVDELHQDPAYKDMLFKEVKKGRIDLQIAKRVPEVYQRLEEEVVSVVKSSVMSVRQISENLKGLFCDKDFLKKIIDVSHGKVLEYLTYKTDDSLANAASIEHVLEIIKEKPILERMALLETVKGVVYCEKVANAYLVANNYLTNDLNCRQNLISQIASDKNLLKKLPEVLQKDVDFMVDIAIKNPSTIAQFPSIAAEEMFSDGDFLGEVIAKTQGKALKYLPGEPGRGRCLLYLEVIKGFSNSLPFLQQIACLEVLRERWPENPRVAEAIQGIKSLKAITEALVDKTDLSDSQLKEWKAFCIKNELDFAGSLHDPLIPYSK